jgi:hypothetical protein
VNDYKENLVTGKTWQRACRVTIDNPLGQQPVLTYVEEQVTDLGNTTMKKLVGALGYSVDMSATIAMRDPVTLALTGKTLPVATVHLALFSDYLNRALDRDGASGGG